MLIETILVVAMPFAVKYVTGLIKNVGPIPTLSYRVALLRALVAVLSLVGAVLTQVLDGVPVDTGLIETALLTVFNAAVATLLYFYQKNKV